MIDVRRLGGLPANIEILRADAELDGVRNVAKLIAGWATGKQRYDRPGEAMFGAFEGDRLIGVGGVSVETALPAMRMRRLYVLQAARRTGVGRMLAEAMTARGFESADLLTCNAAPPGAAEFWEAVGFRRVAGDGWTHERHRRHHEA